MYIKVRFETSGAKTYMYFLPEEYEGSVQEYDDVLVNAQGFIRLAQVVELNCDKPAFPCRIVSAHFPINVTNDLIKIGETFV